MYDKKGDVYICPEGAEMRPGSKEIRKTQRSSWEFFLYSTKQCNGCPVREQCTTNKTGRKIRRWVDHAVLERLKKRLNRNPEMMGLRKSIVEHPFGTMKVGMGHERLLLKGIKNVATEIKLTVLSYNFKRAISILGIETMIKTLEARNLEIQGA